MTSAGGGSSSAQYLSRPHQWQVTTSQLSPNVSQTVQDALENAFHVTVQRHERPVHRPDLGQFHHQQGR